MRTVRLSLVLCLLAGFACLVRADERDQAQRFLVEIRNKPLTFFGEVVDEHGQPIAGATVTMSVEEERMVGNKSLIKRILHHDCMATTDELGAFVIKDVMGWRVKLEDIRANGYQFDTNKQPSLYFFPVTHPSQLKAKYFFRQNRKFPVVFVLVKEKRI
jgi:hypothetical protein